MIARVRLLGFVGIPVVNGLSSLVLLPIVSSGFGASGWGSIAIGMSAGGAVLVALELGWGVDGPMRVAIAGARARKRILSVSLATKALFLVPAVLLAVIIAGIVPNGHALAACLSAAGTALGGLSSIWYFTGISRPWAALLCDPVARLIGTVAACWVGVLCDSLAVLAAGMIVVGMVPPLLTILVIKLKPADFRGLTLRRLWAITCFQRVAMSGRLATSLYIALPVVLVGFVAPQVVPLFATVERLQRMALQFLNAIPNMMQSWIGRASGAERLARADKSIAYSLAYGAAAAIAFALLAPFAAELLLQGEVTLGFASSSLGGVLIIITCVSRATGGLALVARGRVDQLTVSALIGAVIGPIAILLLAESLGVLGGQLGEIAAEIGVLGFQLVALRHIRRRLL